MANENVLQMEMLVESLQLLAASYDVQATILPSFVHIPDEIALIFNDVYRQVRNTNLVTLDQQVNLERIDRLLDQMSDKRDLWALKALRDSPEWEQVRSLALEQLVSLNVEQRSPNLFWIRFIK